MSKGRKVPAKSHFMFPKEVKEEINSFLRFARDAADEAYAAIENLPLDENALAVWCQTQREGYAHRCGIPWQVLDNERADYLYLFEAGGLYKIGITRNIPKRVKSLQTGNPHLITLVGFGIFAAGAANEQEVFKHFASRRMAGEWFALSQEDVTAVQKWFRNGIPSFLRSQAEQRGNQ